MSLSLQGSTTPTTTTTTTTPNPETTPQKNTTTPTNTNTNTNTNNKEIFDKNYSSFTAQDSASGNFSEFTLWSTPAEAEMYENLADLYAVIKVTEALETAFARDIISPEEYPFFTHIPPLFLSFAETTHHTHILCIQSF
jgi:hypothetical protein